MKKLVCIFLSLAVLSGCANVSPEDVSTETTTAQISEEVSSTSQFSRDDFVLFCKDTEEKEPLIWLGMTKDYVTTFQSQYPEYYQGFNTIEYTTSQEIEDGKETGNLVDYVSLVSYTGINGFVETQKGIRTSGLYNLEENSTAEEVIKAYNLDSENENIYIGNPSGDNYTIAIYFNIDENNNVTRIKVPKDADNSSVDTINADYFIKFAITQNHVSSLQLYRKSRTAIRED